MHDRFLFTMIRDSAENQASFETESAQAWKRWRLTPYENWTKWVYRRPLRVQCITRWLYSRIEAT